MITIKKKKLDALEPFLLILDSEGDVYKDEDDLVVLRMSAVELDYGDSDVIEMVFKDEQEAEKIKKKLKKNYIVKQIRFPDE